jgi:hypothetical protein
MLKRISRITHHSSVCPEAPNYPLLVLNALFDTYNGIGSDQCGIAWFDDVSGGAKADDDSLQKGVRFRHAQGVPEKRSTISKFESYG